MPRAIKMAGQDHVTLNGRTYSRTEVIDELKRLHGELPGAKVTQRRWRTERARSERKTVS